MIDGPNMSHVPFSYLEFREFANSQLIPSAERLTGFWRAVILTARLSRGPPGQQDKFARRFQDCGMDLRIRPRRVTYAEVHPTVKCAL